MVVSRPQLLAYSVSNLSSTYAYFAQELQLSQAEIVKLVMASPASLMYGLDSRIKPNVEFLRNEVGVGSKHWRKIVYAYPQVFSYSVDTVYRPK
eukprot:4146095-Ditylum_brightwellii.AAC.1